MHKQMANPYASNPDDAFWALTAASLIQEAEAITRKAAITWDDARFAYLRALSGELRYGW